MQKELIEKNLHKNICRFFQYKYHVVTKNTIEKVTYESELTISKFFYIIKITDPENPDKAINFVLVLLKSNDNDKTINNVLNNVKKNLDNKLEYYHDYYFLTENDNFQITTINKNLILTYKLLSISCVFLSTPVLSITPGSNNKDFDTHNLITLLFYNSKKKNNNLKFNFPNQVTGKAFEFKDY